MKQLNEIEKMTKIVAMILLASIFPLGTSQAANIYVPNFSFESQPTQFVDPRIDSWQKNPQPATFDTNVFGAWDNLSGLFVNPPSTNADHLDNAEGNQLVYLFSYPEAGFFQDNNSTDWSGVASHAFNAKFEVGKSYRLTAAITTSRQQPLVPGATLQLSLYYRDASNHVTPVAATTVTYDTNLFSNLTHLLDFHVSVPGVRATDPWAGKNIGIQIQSTVAPNLIGGVWDLDNIRLTESIAVPNYSFESQPTQFVDPRIDFWQKNPQPPTFDTNTFGAWDNLAGLFVNPPSTNADYIDNVEGNQLVYLFSYPQAGFFQDNDSTDWSGTTSHAFNTKYEVGKSYRLTAGLTSSKEQPLAPGATLLLTLYYRDASNNMVTVAATNVTYDTNIFSNITHLLDVQAATAPVREADPWAGKNIGIQFQSTAAPNFIGGVWDIDNVRLDEIMPATLTAPALANGQFTFTIRSEPGLRFEILAATNIVTSLSNWTSLGTVTNITGAASFTDPAANGAQRFYNARQLP